MGGTVVRAGDRPRPLLGRGFLQRLEVSHLAFRVQGLGFRVEVSHLGFRVEGLGFRV